MAEGTAKPVSDMSFEEALRELEAVVSRLETGDVPLEESIDLYARGAELRTHCDSKLKAAEARVAQISEAADGAVTAQPVDIS